MPNRIIKESICTSENLDQLTAFQEVVFFHLIVCCDDYGRFTARPKTLASLLFPNRSVRTDQIEDALRGLTSAELVTIYTVDGKPFLQMNTWDRHQTVRAKKSKYPGPEQADAWQLQADASKCKQMKPSESKCKQMKSSASKCMQMQANVSEIQSETKTESYSETKAKTTRPAARVDVFAAYANDDLHLLDALRQFAQMRATIKKPMTERAKELLCGKLEKFPPADRVAILEASIAHSWTDIYPLKEEQAQKAAAAGYQRHDQPISPKMLEAARRLLEQEENVT